MIYLDLFIGFLKVGCFSFGGAYAAIPLIRDVVLEYGWIDDEMLSYMIAVSESTPGPIMINLATYVGTIKAGIPGALLATFAVIIPSFIVIIIVTALLDRYIDNKYVQALLGGIKPCMIGIILAVGIWMIISNISALTSFSIDIKAVVITSLLAVIYFGVNTRLKKKISPIMLIVISAVIGAVAYSI